MNQEEFDLSSSKLRARISTIGAELTVLRDEHDRDLLWDGDPIFWRGRSPLLFPVVGSVKNDKVTIDGRNYPMRRHGFARVSRFNCLSATSTTCQLQLLANDDTRASFPFEFQLLVAYALVGNGLEAVVTVTNMDNKPMPFSFGFHPGFRWPLPYGQSRHKHGIWFEKDEDAPIRRLDHGLLGASCQSPVERNYLPLHDALFEHDVMIFDRLKSRSLMYGAQNGPRLKVEFPGMPNLGIWTKPGAPFICIEPWQGYASPIDFEGELADKPGSIILPPGASHSFGMTLSLVESS